MLIKNFATKPKYFRRVLCFFSANFDVNKDYYKILGVEKSATDAQIKSAYYKLAMKFHPDHNKGNQSKFKQINQAYSILSDAQSKKDYQNAKNYGSQRYSNSSSSSYSNQDYYQNYRNQGSNNSYNQNYNYNDQWKNNNQWQNTQWQRAQWQNRKYYYQNPYEAYDHFRQQYQQAQRQRIKRRTQQYQQQMRKQQEYQDQISKNTKNAIKTSFIFAIFLTLILFGMSRKKQPIYIDQYGNIHDYGLVNINGNPYLQKQPNYGNNNSYGNPAAPYTYNNNNSRYY